MVAHFHCYIQCNDLSLKPWFWVRALLFGVFCGCSSVSSGLPDTSQLTAALQIVTIAIVVTFDDDLKVFHVSSCTTAVRAWAPMAPDGTS